MATRISVPSHLRIDGATVSRQLELFRRGRVFEPYQRWEDHAAGLFGGRLSDDFVAASQALLAGPECLTAMRCVLEAWPVATAVNLTNTGLNRRAWVGQAACCFQVGSTAAETKRAWWQLSESQRAAANACADEVIALWHTDKD